MALFPHRLHDATVDHAVGNWDGGWYVVRDVLLLLEKLGVPTEDTLKRQLHYYGFSTRTTPEGLEFHHDEFSRDAVGAVVRNEKPHRKRVRPRCTVANLAGALEELRERVDKLERLF